jgi:hypothetical protein
MTVAATLVAVVTAVMLAERVARWLADPYGGAAGVDVVGAPMAAMRSARGFARAAGALQAFWLVLATIVDLLLIYDARYRDFPSLLFAPVVIGFVALALARGVPRPGARREVEERLLIGALVVGSAVLVVMELPINLAADLWALLCVALAAATWVNGAVDRPGGGPASAPRS